MRTQHYQAQTLAELFNKQKVATLPEMKNALSTNSHMTVFRKLIELGYKTSYSHRGKFYTLKAIPHFDDQGLWFHKGVRFSHHGTLTATCQSFVGSSEKGYSAAELDGILQVSTGKILRKLASDKRLVRRRVSGRYLYFSADSAAGRNQLQARRIMEAEFPLGAGQRRGGVSGEQLKTVMILFYSLLNEKLRRLWAGLESLKLGYGGDCKMAGLLGMDVHTVAKGRGELLQVNIDTDRVRKVGGGRKSIKKNAEDHG